MAIRQMVGWIDGWTEREVDGRKVGWMDGSINGMMDRWKDE